MQSYICHAAVLMAMATVHRVAQGMLIGEQTYTVRVVPVAASASFSNLRANLFGRSRSGFVRTGLGVDVI